MSKVTLTINDEKYVMVNCNCGNFEYLFSYPTVSYEDYKDNGYISECHSCGQEIFQTCSGKQHILIDDYDIIPYEEAELYWKMIKTTYLKPYTISHEFI